MERRRVGTSSGSGGTSAPVRSGSAAGRTPISDEDGEYKHERQEILLITDCVLLGVDAGG